MLRKALGESAQDRNYIATVPGRGYRFVADVREVAKGNGAPEPARETENRSASSLPVIPSKARDLDSEAKTEIPRVARHDRRMVVFAALAVVLVSAAVASMLVLKNPHPSKTGSGGAPGRIVLPVLPFANLTGDAAQDYLTDGLTEEMITQLGRLDPQRLGIIARTSVMHYKNSQASLESIARELGVDYVLEGAFRRDSDNVRITAQLIRTTARVTPIGTHKPALAFGPGADVCHGIRRHER